ncbi:hypothetical protein [Denitrificimonas caeni]|uniref:hypothetical protein n=1 Tax=Denitrificimonas caeni TaxID=521720 RepID=UPI0003B446CA|nr:hypothetical protein [Denitrificimonas caeni]
MNWNSVKQHFEDHGALVDIFYEGMNNDRWLKLFQWLKGHNALDSVNCYIPSKDKNLDLFPNLLESVINEKGFYCFASIKIEGVIVFFRFYEGTELECDVSPKEIDSMIKVDILLNLLSEVQRVVMASRYIMCPENSRDQIFNINGKFVS